MYVCMFRSINKCTSICTPKMIICLICTCIPLYITVFKGLQNPHHKKLTTSRDWLQYTLNYFSKVKVQYNKISTQIRQLHKFVDRVPGHPKGSTKKQTSRPKSSLENGLQSIATHVGTQMAMITGRLCVLEVIEHLNHWEYDWMPKVWLCI